MILKKKRILRKHQVLAELCATKCHAHDYKRHQRLISSSVLIANPCDGGCTACAKGAFFATLNSKMNTFPLEFRDNFCRFGISVKIRVTCQKFRPYAKGLKEFLNRWRWRADLRLEKKRKFFWLKLAQERLDSLKIDWVMIFFISGPV